MAESTAHPHTGADPTRGRWGIVVAAVLVQLALGAVYAWSVLNKPLQAQFGWSKAEAVLPFEVAIGAIFIGSLVGCRIQDRLGPRPVGAAPSSPHPRPRRCWPAPTTGRAVAGSRDYTLSEALRTRQWYLLTAVLALNVTCGIALISQAADATEDITDKIGRMTAFVGMLGHYTVPFTVIAIVALVALVLQLITRMPSDPRGQQPGHRTMSVIPSPRPGRNSPMTG